MKRKFFAFILLVSAGLSLSSCLGDDEDTNIEYTHDTAITAFSLGTMNRYYQSKTSAGADTTISTTVTGSDYKFNIDQTNRQIYNTDSLPVGTKTSAALATITAKQSSPLVWVLKNQSGEDSLAYYSSSDSVDFSSPRQIRVYNNDYTAYATYTIKVNVHTEECDSFVWRSLTMDNAALAALDSVKAVTVGGNVYVFGSKDNQTLIYKTANTDGKTWSAVTPNVSLGAKAYKSAVAKGGVLYILNNGTILKSSDAASWEEVATDASLLQLIGASSNYLYAYTTADAKSISGIAVSKDNGATWTADGLDKSASLLPTQNLSMVISSVRSVKNAENLLFFGGNQNDSIATLWTRTLDYAASTDSYQWNYAEFQRNQGDKLPYLNTLHVALNDSGYVALAASKWYISKTGLEWSVDSTVAVPSLSVDKSTAFVRDDNQYYWIINGGNVWKGRYNRDGWRKE